MIFPTFFPLFRPRKATRRKIVGRARLSYNGHFSEISSRTMQEYGSVLIIPLSILPESRSIYAFERRTVPSLPLYSARTSPLYSLPKSSYPRLKENQIFSLQRNFFIPAKESARSVIFSISEKDGNVPSRIISPFPKGTALTRALSANSPSSEVVTISFSERSKISYHKYPSKGFPSDQTASIGFRLYTL